MMQVTYWAWMTQKKTYESSYLLPYLESNHGQLLRKELYEQKMSIP